MGSYTYFIEEDIEIIDKDGLADFLKKAKDGTYTEYQQNEYVNELEIDNFTFEVFDSWKIISYWYDDFVTLLRDLAIFIKGSAKFVFETDDECAEIIFSDHKCKISIGKMQYSDYTPEELARKMPIRNAELQKYLMAMKV